MPTGYTSVISEGATFEQFLWGCARAFGAFIMQRDDSSDAPPELDEKPSDWQEVHLAQAIAEQKRFDTLSGAQWRQEWKADQDAERKRHAEYVAEKEKLEASYRAMLAQVRDWTPPTTEHEGLKRFMIQQIEESIEFDCSVYEPTFLPFEEWKAERIRRTALDITYHREHHAAEVERVAQRNKWKADLLASVPLPEKSKAKTLAHAK